MATKEAMKKRRNDILMRLEKGGSASIQELIKITGTKERTLQTDIKSLRDAGNKIELKGDRVTLLDEVKDVAEPSSYAVARQVAVMLLLGEKDGLKKKQILDALFTSAEDKELESIRKNFASDISAMLESGIIFEKKDDTENDEDCEDDEDDEDDEDEKDDTENDEDEDRNTKYFLSSSTMSFQKYKDRSLEKIYGKIIASAESTPYSSVLYVIADKIADIMQYRMCCENPAEKQTSFSVRNTKEKIENYYDSICKILKTPFKTKKLKIQWKNSIDEEIISVEKIVYSCEKGKMYLIGVEDKSPTIYRKRPKDFADIIKVEETSSINTIYNNDGINRILEESVNIDTSKPHQIEVRFKKTPNICEQIKKFAETRPRKAKIREEKGEIIYSDTIRGVYDIAKVLRKFGSSCKITKDFYKPGDPSKDLKYDLKKIMYDSAKETIERYSDGKDK